MNRQSKLNERRRFTVQTRKQQLQDLQSERFTGIAQEVATKLEPFIKAEITRQLDEALEELKVSKCPVAPCTLSHPVLRSGSSMTGSATMYRG